MAFIAITCVPDPVAPRAAHSSDPQAAAASATADAAAVTSDITAALANVTISGDSTALGLVTQIQTDFAVVLADLGTAPGASVALSYDPAVVATKNMLRACIAAMLRAVDGAADLT